MRQFYRVMLGGGSKLAPQAFEGCFIGTDYEIDQDLSDRLPDRWQDFNHEFIPIYQQIVPRKTKIGADPIGRAATVPFVAHNLALPPEQLKDEEARICVISESVFMARLKPHPTD